MITKPQIAIIGGGAAGLMTAASLLEQHAKADIHLFERNTYLGAKVIISGGGRCNVTTGITDKKLLLSKYTRGSEFLKTAIYDFPPEKVKSWFEEHGVPLKIEEDLRVFPRSDDGKDIVKAFENLFKKGKVHLHLKETVASVTPTTEQKFTITTNTGSAEYDFVVITTGGNAYQHTGSKGDGYSFARACGHSITRLGPSLNSFLTAEEWPKKLSGLSLENARLETITESGEKKQAIGPMIFTHFGISGPSTFALSSHLAFTPISKDTPHQIQLIPEATKNFERWDEQLRQSIATSGQRQMQTILGDFLTHRLAEAILTLAHVSPQKKSAEISKEERKKIVQLLSGSLTLILIQRRPGDEFVTAGGVELSEVDHKTMASKKCPGLYFAGEILDVDGLTGGFNLQASWAMGRLAGKSIAERISKT